MPFSPRTQVLKAWVATPLGSSRLPSPAAASVVAAGYGSADRTVAQLGVVGPTHMDYSGTMRAVHAVARYVGRLLTEA